jgi:hypothetical protein
MQMLGWFHGGFRDAAKFRAHMGLGGHSAQRSTRRRGRAIGSFVIGIAIAAGMAFAGPSPVAASSDGEQTTITGEVLDAACYLAHGRKGAGPGHRRCADECINKKNLPIGLLMADDKVVLLLPDHANEAPYEELKKHASETVIVEGKRVERGGLPGVIVSAVKKP